MRTTFLIGCLLFAACGGQTAAGPQDSSVDASAPDTSDAADAAISPPPPAKSCRGTPGADHLCGSNNDDDCCASLPVPGGSFFRYYDGLVGIHQDYPATVSGFYFDKYLVTVGRFRAFVEAYPASKPKPGDGTHPKIPGSGWDASWPLPADATALRAELLAPQDACRDDKGATDVRTWTDAPAKNEQLPISCVTWYLLSAFCAWDGGRLPTDAEWNFAAAAGQEQRVYPWSTIKDKNDADSSRAIYREKLPFPLSPGPVGSKPKGVAKWGHLDLSGNMEEVALDRVPSSKPPVPCVDCALLGPLTNGVVTHGGSWGGVRDSLLVILGGATAVDSPAGWVGVRCAR